MGAVLTDSALYSNLHIKKYVGDARDRGGRVVPIPFSFAIRANPVDGDTYNCCVLPANCQVIGLLVTTDGIAGTNTTVALGDSGVADRYMVATDMDTLNTQGALAITGMLYRPTADTIVVATVAASTPTAAKVVKGVFLVVPSA
jgi:hypothetical protein